MNGRKAKALRKLANTMATNQQGIQGQGGGMVFHPNGSPRRVYQTLKKIYNRGGLER